MLHTSSCLVRHVYCNNCKYFTIIRQLISSLTSEHASDVIWNSFHNFCDWEINEWSHDTFLFFCIIILRFSHVTYRFFYCSLVSSFFFENFMKNFFHPFKFTSDALLLQFKLSVNLSVNSQKVPSKLGNYELGNRKLSF